MAQQVQSTPGDYVLSQAQSFTIGAVYALYDGSGAAGSYVPTLEIVSDSGHKVLTVPQDTTITAGSNAEATWAPFLGTKVSALSVITVGAYAKRPNSSPVSVPSGFTLSTTIPFTQVIFDTSNFWSAGTPDRFTIPKAGTYLFAATAGFATNGTGGRAASIYKNGTTNMIANQTAPSSDFFWGGSAVVTDQFIAGDYVELRVAQHSGGALNTGDCWLSVFAVGT